MDKAELIRHEIEKRKVHNLAIGNPLFAVMAEEDIELLSFIDSLQEEPVSEDLEEVSKNYALNNTPWDDCKDEIQESFKAGAKWKETKDKSCSEDLGEYINELSKQFQEVSFAKLSRIAVRVAKWQKEQMMTKAINGVARPDDGEVWCDLKPFNLKDGDKVKVIIIKED